MKKILIYFIRWFSDWVRSYKTRYLCVSRQLKLVAPTSGPYLIIVPHADDELIGCHQFIQNHLDNVTIFYCGFLGSNPSEENRAVRAGEFVRYCQNVGVNYVCAENDIRHSLYTYLDELKPCTLLLPSYIDWHKEHRKVNEYLIDYLDTHKDSTIQSLIWYHISVPLYGGDANFASLMNEQQQRAKWDYFEDTYLSQKTINIKRFVLAERDCIEDSYAAETFLVMDKNTFCMKMKMLINKEQELDNLKGLLNDYNTLVQQSSFLYKL